MTEEGGGRGCGGGGGGVGLGGCLAICSHFAVLSRNRTPESALISSFPKSAQGKTRRRPTSLCHLKISECKPE